MSLILEALRKLEREKNLPDRGFVVMAPVSWGPTARSRVRLVAAATSLFVVVAGFTVGYLWVRGARPRGPAPSVAGSAPVPQSTAAAPMTQLADTAPERRSAAPAPGAAMPPRPSQPWLATDRPTSASVAPPRSSPPTAPPEPGPPIPTPARVAVPTTAPAMPQSAQTARRETPEPPRVSARPAASAAVEKDTARTRQAPPASPVASATNEPLQLEAISMRDGRPIAVLSGRLVQEGDHFDGVRVLRIGAAEVELEVRGRRRTIRF